MTGLLIMNCYPDFSIFLFNSELKSMYLVGFTVYVYLSFLLLLLITVFSRLNAGGVYLKFGLVDPTFIRGQAFIY